MANEAQPIVSTRGQARRLSSAVALGFVALVASACAISHPYGTDPESGSGALTSGGKGSPKQRSGGLVLSQIDPASVPAGSNATGLSVTITGTGFTNASKVALAGKPVDTTFGSDTQLKATIPGPQLASAGGLQISVQSEDGSTQSNAVSLVVFNASSTLASVNPTTASVRDPSVADTQALDIKGSGFDHNSVVVFNGTDVQTSLLDATSLHAAVPSSLMVNPGVVNVSVKGGGSVSSPLSFTITDDPNVGATINACGGSLMCSDFNLGMFECVQLDTGMAQCESDGCLYEGCM